MGYLFILLSVSASLTEGFLIKIYNKKHEKGGFVFTAVVSLFSMLFFLLFDLITDRSGLTFTVQMLPYAFVAGAAYCTASVFTFFALKNGPYALTMLILSYSLVITMLYGLIFLKEKVEWTTYVGFVLIAVSLFFVRGEKTEEDEKKKKSFLWVLFIVISVICAGIFGITQRMQQIRFENKVTNEFMMITLGFSSLASFAVGCISDGKKSFGILARSMPYASIAGLANGATNAFKMLAFLTIPISIESPTAAGVKIVLSFLLSVLALKEKLLKRQIIGVICGGIAVVLLNI